MITLVCGLPNAGKTTYAGDRALHLDDFRFGYVECNEAAQAFDEVCVEGTYNTRRRRTQFLDAVKQKGGKRVCVWVDTPLAVCLEREREGRKRGDHTVINCANQFEPPTYDEGWDEIIRIG